jgi:hypothetical protein
MIFSAYCHLHELCLRTDPQVETAGVSTQNAKFREIPADLSRAVRISPCGHARTSDIST